MDTLEGLRSIGHGVVVTILLVGVVAAMVVNDAVLGRRDHRRLLTDEAEGVRLSLYRRWTISGWATGAVVLLGLLTLGVAPGLRAPDLSTYLPDESSSSLAGLLTGAVIGIVIVGAGNAYLSRRGRTNLMPGATSVTPMLPTTSRGRRGWAGLSLMAGVTEEITYRALVILTVVAVAPAASRLQVLLAAAAIFGLAHWYQGAWGVLATAAMGFAFGGLYLATGSLIPGMIVHVLIDLRALMIKGPAHPTTPSSATPTSTPAAAAS